jgi:Tol biopolymer transport system component
MLKDNRPGRFFSLHAYRLVRHGGAEFIASLYARQAAQLATCIFDKNSNMLHPALFICLLCSVTALAQSPKIKRITGVNDSYPVLSPDGKILLFQSDRSGDVELWSMGIDGTGLKKLTGSKGYDGNPSWSPDGKNIAFASARAGDLDIYIMSADGSGPTRLTSTKGNDGHPHWYPDGSRIIFNSARTSDTASEKDIDEIFSMKSDGSDVRQLTDLKSVSTYASVSPDGMKIVFRGSTSTPAFAWDMSSTPKSLNSEIFVMDIDGKNVVNISNSASFDGWPYWSPDSRKVVFASNRSGKPNSGQLYVCSADGSELQQLTDLPGAVAQPYWSPDGNSIYGYQLWETPDEEYGFVVEIPIIRNNTRVAAGNSRPVTSAVDCYPVPSPDGNAVVFQSNRTGNWEIYTINVDGSNLKQLTDLPGPDVSPVWSPDGSLIVFASERDNDSEIYLMKSDGSSQTRLTNIPGDDSHPHWFPDGRRILFNSSQNTPDQTKDWSLQFHDVYSITIDGKDIQRYTDNKTVTTYSSVSPDGNMIAFRKVTDSPAYNWDMTLNKRSRNSDVYVMDIGTKEQIDVSQQSPGYDGWPAWLRDSKSVVFVSNRNGKAGGGQLFIADTKGTTVRQLTDLPGAIIQHSVSLDGKFIFAYQCFETTDVEYGNIVRLEIQ